MSSTEQQVDFWHRGLSTTQSTALKLLGQGISSVMVASTIGVSEGLISQFLAEPRFAEEVTKLKIAGLQKQTGIDHKYVEAEDRLADKLLKMIPLMNKPMDVLKGLQVINATKRRGMADSTLVNQTTQIVQITLPGNFAAKFVKDITNRIVEVQDDSGSQSLVTTTPAALDRLAKESIRDTEALVGVGWENSVSTADIIQQASERVKEPVVAETLPAGLRQGFSAKRAITADDL